MYAADFGGAFFADSCGGTDMPKPVALAVSPFPADLGRLQRRFLPGIDDLVSGMDGAVFLSDIEFSPSAFLWHSMGYPYFPMFIWL